MIIRSHRKLPTIIIFDFELGKVKAFVFVFFLLNLVTSKYMFLNLL